MKTTANTKAIRKMSDTVIECELRQGWNEVACNMRGNVQPSRRLSDYVAALTAEQARRKQAA
jgi:hypothetical protein